MPQLFIETLSAQIATLPIIAMVFGQISIISIFANIITLPLIPFVMLSVFLTGFFGYIFTPLAIIFGLISNLMTGLIINSTNLISSLPWAVAKINFSSFVGFFYYVALTLICWYLVFITKYRLREVNIVD